MIEDDLRHATGRGGTVMTAQVCFEKAVHVDRVYHAEPEPLCEDLSAAQTAEIAQLRAWLCQWYGIYQ